MVPSSKLARMIEALNDVISTGESHNSHEKRPAIQNNFGKDVVNQVSSFEELGIPFMEARWNLTGLYRNEEILWTVRTVRQIGEQQFSDIEGKTRALAASLQKNNFSTFNT